MTQSSNSRQQLSLGISSHNNHYLFSDYFLNYILKDPNVYWSQYWSDAAREVDSFLDAVSQLYDQEQNSLASYSESQLEDNWFKKIFALLGHTFEGQAKVSKLKGSGVRFPDFAFFPDDATRQTAASNQNDSSVYFKKALAVGEVKKWDLPLGKKVKGGENSFDNNNPSYQIDYYIRATELTWGILSNGRLWRLVHKDSSYKLDIYFEIDLVKAIVDYQAGKKLVAQNSENKELLITARAAGIFFILFFRQASFLLDAHGRVFLDAALEASVTFATKLEDDLRENAYKALEQLIQGFIEPSANNLTADDLPEIYTNSLYLLYRIIFLFYGESRGLLPIENKLYQEQSLTKFARDIATDIDNNKRFLHTGRNYWSRLQQLFVIISGERADLNRELGVPRYNGGLFNPALHPFLEEKFVGDKFLVDAIDALARREATNKSGLSPRETVDYRTLGVRQIGSIYEGLLEYQPRRAEGEMVAVKKGKTEEWLLLENALKNKKIIVDTRQAGDVYLVTDKGERKATGSYYTPDYIVKYIVDNTLGPLVQAARERVKATGKGDNHAQQFVDEILKLRVLDPAMGSGHFLVEVTDYLARVIATDVYVTVNEVEDTDDDDLTVWRRKVVERCIYGVDKNPMAAELAKLSLWLVTVAKDKPLSFLDHHLRHGDSLVGARLADLTHLPSGKKKQQVADNQQALFDEAALTQDMTLAVGGMLAIEQATSDTIEDIYNKEQIFRELQETHIAKWRTIADLWTSHFFGNEMAPEAWPILFNYLQGYEPAERDEMRLLRPHLEYGAVQKNDFFHWELEFPELFFDEYGRGLNEQAGFDAVVGNPPYVRQELLRIYKPFYQEKYASYDGSADLYLYFYEIGVELINVSGYMAYISSGTFAKTNSAKPFREWLPKNAEIITLIDFGENQPFDGAEMVRPSIVVMRKGAQTTDFQSMFMDGTTVWRPLDKAIKEHGFECDSSVLERPEWTFQSVEKASLFEKIMSKGTPLEEIVQGAMYRGILTGLNDAFYIDQSARDELVKSDPTCSQFLKSNLRGADLRPWYQQDEGRWIIVIPSGWTIETFGADLDELLAWSKFSALHPSLANYLEPFAMNARKRLDKGDYWWELRPCSYYSEFDKPKILWSDITKLPRFSWDDKKQYINQKCYTLPAPHPSLLSILQSRVNCFMISQICTPLRLRAGLWQYQVLSQFVARLPIPKTTESQENRLGEIALTITDLAKERYQFHQQMRHRIQSDLGTDGRTLNTKLTYWWGLDFPSFRTELKKVFRRDIPLSERNEWEKYLAAQVAQHDELTQQIIALETELNEIVYKLFDLTPDEIAIIEESTKYPYGEV